VTQKPGASEDPRVQRTRKLILEAFIALTVERGFAAVTVRDITERATINRSTFYRYYLDKYALLDALTGEELEDDAAAEGDDEEEHPGPVRLLRRVRQHADFYRVMLGTKGDPYFADLFRQNTEKRFRSWLQGQDDPNAPPLDLRVRYVSYAGVGAILWWLEQTPEISPEQLARWLSQLSLSIMGPFAKGKAGQSQ
jgi:AcrR family transcriptional regulator